MSRIAFLSCVGAALAVAVPLARATDDANDKAVKRFKAALQGKWQMTARVQGGEPSEADLIKKRSVTFEGDKYTVRDDSETLGELDYKIDPGKKPAWLDVTTKEGNSGKGIIKLDGDTLTFCVATDGDRPGDFKSEKGDGRILATFKKVKK